MQSKRLMYITILYAKRIRIMPKTQFLKGGLLKLSESEQDPKFKKQIKPLKLKR